jgi:hypothetical protein
VAKAANAPTRLGKTKKPAAAMSARKFLSAAPVPGWLKEAWIQAKEEGVDKMTDEKIDAEIEAHRWEKRTPPPTGTR